MVFPSFTSTWPTLRMRMLIAAVRTRTLNKSDDVTEAPRPRTNGLGSTPLPPTELITAGLRFVNTLLGLAIGTHSNTGAGHRASQAFANVKSATRQQRMPPTRRGTFDQTAMRVKRAIRIRVNPRTNAGRESTSFWLDSSQQRQEFAYRMILAQ